MYRYYHKKRSADRSKLRAAGVNYRHYAMWNDPSDRYIDEVDPQVHLINFFNDFDDETLNVIVKMLRDASRDRNISRESRGVVHMAANVFAYAATTRTQLIPFPPISQNMKRLIRIRILQERLTAENAAYVANVSALVDSQEDHLARIAAISRELAAVDARAAAPSSVALVPVRAPANVHVNAPANASNGNANVNVDDLD
jgi:hypothetical protein